MSDPVVLRSIKRVGEDNHAFDSDDKRKKCILQSPPYVIKHVKKVVGGLSEASGLQNTKQILCGITTVMWYLLSLVCCPQNNFSVKNIIIPIHGQPLQVN